MVLGATHEILQRQKWKAILVEIDNVYMREGIVT